MILNISEAANLGIHALTYLAYQHDSGRSVATTEIADSFEISANHLSKVLQRLSKTGMVRSVRGPRGGFVLAKKPNDITLLNIYEAIDGALSLHSQCLQGVPTCGFDECIFGGLISDVHARVKAYFSQTTLADIVAKNPPPPNK